MAKITFKITAVTDVGLVRTNNEDNFIAISDLDVANSTWKSDTVCELGDKGALLVVADGMGGMNAGEVASEIAISTVKELFTQGITEKTVASNDSIISFMNDAIVTADKRIKSEGKRNPESRGMGTTIVIAWLYKGLLYVSWCGDSRAYIYNENMGLVRITKDHSYVQELVDQGVVRPEDAFDFPESNVITRCLSHSSLKAEPENLRLPYQVNSGDIILLCTDGLCGMIRDQEISSILAANTDSMGNCATALIEAAKNASGADNITVDLCQILSVSNEIPRMQTAEISDILKASTQVMASGQSDEKNKKESPKKRSRNKAPKTSQNPESPKKTISIKLRAIIYTVLICAIIGGVYLLDHYFSKSDNKPNEAVPSTENKDSLNNNAVELPVIDTTLPPNNK